MLPDDLYSGRVGEMTVEDYGNPIPPIRTTFPTSPPGSVRAGQYGGPEEEAANRTPSAPRAVSTNVTVVSSNSENGAPVLASGPAVVVGGAFVSICGIWRASLEWREASEGRLSIADGLHRYILGYRG